MTVVPSRYSIVSLTKYLHGAIPYMVFNTSSILPKMFCSNDYIIEVKSIVNTEHQFNGYELSNIPTPEEPRPVVAIARGAVFNTYLEQT